MQRPVDEYVEAAVQRLLTEDGHTAEQGLCVSRREHAIVLSGEVESAQRRDDILRLIAANFPGVPVLADIGVTRAAPPAEVEELT